MAIEKPSSYCEAVLQMAEDSVHRNYHNNEYGFPIHDDNELFGRLLLEINQAGLSWTTILNKAQSFREAYSGFQIDVIASYNSEEIQRLLDNPGIIRNRLKINAAIHNAQQIQDLQSAHGSFVNWLDHHHPMTKEKWVKLFKKTLKFTGGEITNEFLLSTGYLEGAHVPECPIYNKVLAADPRWKTHK